MFKIKNLFQLKKNMSGCILIVKNKIIIKFFYVFLKKSINRLPIVFFKNLINNKPSINQVISKSVVLFVYFKDIVELNRYPEIFQDNVFCLLQECYEYGFNVFHFFYTFACIAIRLCYPYHESLLIKLTHRIFGALSALNDGNRSLAMKNFQISLLTCYSLMTNNSLKMSIRSQSYQAYYQRMLGVKGSLDPNLPLFDNAEPNFDMVFDTFKVNCKNIFDSPQLLPFDSLMSLNLEMENFQNIKNIILDVEETKTLKYLKCKRQITIRKMKPKGFIKPIIKPIKKKIIAEFEIISKQVIPYVSSTEENSRRNLAEWDKDHQTTKIFKQESTQIIKYEPERKVNSFVLRDSFLSYYISNERRYIRELAIANYQLSGQVLLDKLAYKKMLDNQFNLKIHQHRAKVLRRIERKVHSRNSYNRHSFYRKIILF